jgi:hypothetical protein
MQNTLRRLYEPYGSGYAVACRMVLDREWQYHSSRIVLVLEDVAGNGLVRRHGGKLTQKARSRAQSR